MSSDIESLSLIISKKKIMGSKHKVVYPQENPYAKYIYDIFCTEMKLHAVFHIIKNFDTSHSLGLDDHLLETVLDAQSRHLASAGKLKEILNRQRYMTINPRKNYKRSYALTLYSTLAFPNKARSLIVIALAQSLERALLEKYQKSQKFECSFLDRKVLTENIESVEAMMQKLKRRLD